MSKPRPKMDGWKIVCWAVVDSTVLPTGRTRHWVGGALQGPALNLAIATFPGDSGYYLLYCDDAWNPITDTHHATVEEAKHQAEFEYDGITSHWQE